MSCAWGQGGAYRWNGRIAVTSNLFHLLAAALGPFGFLFYLEAKTLGRNRQPTVFEVRGSLAAWGKRVPYGLKTLGFNCCWLDARGVSTVSSRWQGDALDRV